MVSRFPPRFPESSPRPGRGPGCRRGPVRRPGVRTFRRLLPAAAAAVAFAAATAEARVSLRLATVAPNGSAWHLILQELAAGIGRETDREVRIRILAGGAAGDETDLIRKMRIGQVHLAAISNVGLAELDASAWTLSIPMVFRDYDEWDRVREAVNPTIEESLQEHGFRTLAWAEVGWVHFFATEPIHTLADIQDLRLAGSATDPTAVDLLRWAGFDPVPINTVEMVSGFQTGLVEAAGLPVILAEGSQIYRSAGFMNDLRWAPLQGAVVIHESAWERLEPAQQEIVARLSAAAAAEFRRTNRLQEEKSLAAMKSRGLTVIEASDAFRAEWQAAAEATWPMVRERLVPPAVFDEVLRLRDEYRRSKN